jgi:hypothetical protein
LGNPSYVLTEGHFLPIVEAQLRRDTLRGVIMGNAKELVRELLEKLPDDATLSDITHELNDSLYTLYVRQQIERGMQASNEGRITPHEDVKKRFVSDQS